MAHIFDEKNKENFRNQFNQASISLAALIEDRDKQDAHQEIANLRAMIELCRNNTYACVVKINRLKAGLSLNERMIPVFMEEIQEIEKFLRGEPNNWE